MLRRLLALTTAIVVAGALSGCGSTDSWVQARAATGWSAQYADAANSSHSPVSGADTLRLDWSRAVKGELGAQVALSSDDYLAANAQTRAGCSLMVWENDNRGRQRWCTRLVLGGGFASPLFDGFDNLYIGQPGLVQSFPLTQWVRWRRPVIGMPMTMRLLSPGALLVVTHLGQVLVFDAQGGTVEGQSLDLVAGIDPTDSTRGLEDCRLGLRGCPVAAAPAYTDSDGTVVLSLWQPDTPAPVLVGLRYKPDQTPALSRAWTSEAVGGGPIASPVLSADGSTIYVNGRDERLWALHTDDGSPKWSVPLGYLAQTPPSVTPDGLILAGGGPGARLTAIRDSGDGGEKVWTRPETAPLTTSSLAGVGYTIVAGGDKAAGVAGGDQTAGVAEGAAPGQALLVFDLGDGHTLNRYPLPNATGFPLGVSIGQDRRVVAAASGGQVYGFAPAGGG